MTALMKRVLFATDFSACADRALGYALAVANVWKSALSVMTVLELYPGMDPEYTVNKMYLDHLRDDANRQLAVLEGKVKETWHILRGLRWVEQSPVAHRWSGEDAGDRRWFLAMRVSLTAAKCAISTLHMAAVIKAKDHAHRQGR